MASMVAKVPSSTSQALPAMPIQEKGSRNKRKFRADPPIGDTFRNISVPPNEFSSYEFSAEKFEITPSHGNQVYSDSLKLDLGLSTAAGSSEVGPSRSREERELADGFHDADWSDLTESQLEELVLSNLDAIFRSAIKKIVACGYSEEVAMKAVLRSGYCYGCKDTVSNIVDNTLVFLRNSKEIDLSREHYFKDLEQMEKYILAELVCGLREVRPLFSTGDAMWCLLICDMNVAHACAMDIDPLGSLVGDVDPSGSESGPAKPQLRSESKTCQLNLFNSSKPNPLIACAQTCQCEIAMPTFSGVPNLVNPRNSVVPEKEDPISKSDSGNNSFNVVQTTQFNAQEEKFGGSRKISGVTKREYILRQKSLHLEKCYRTYGSKGSSRAGKFSAFGGLIVDKKVKSVSYSTGVSGKNASLKINKTVGVDLLQDKGTHNFSATIGLPSPMALNMETVNTAILPKTNSVSTISSPPASSAADTDLSLSLTTKSNLGASNSTYAIGKKFPQDKKDEMILKLAPRVQELENQLQEWTEWANQKVMQAARRLSKDKVELKTLRQEREEVERLKKEKQTLEESTMKKLSEMANALGKASGQVDRANSAVRRLEVENAALRQHMEAARLRAAESAASCQEVSMREKKTLMKFQSWEKQKTLFQEDMVAEKRKLAQLQLELEQAKDVRDQLEARWKQEEKAKEELLTQANSIRKEREKIEASSKSKEEMIKSKAESNLQKYKVDIKKLEKEVSQLTLKTDSSKIEALKRDIRSYSPSKEFTVPYNTAIVSKFQDCPGNGGVKRERECVMCLSEEMSVVFLPCAHQVVCTTCNELHEKQGMKDCPSCRSPIQRRICVHYSLS